MLWARWRETLSENGIENTENFNPKITINYLFNFK